MKKVVIRLAKGSTQSKSGGLAIDQATYETVKKLKLDHMTFTNCKQLQNRE